MHTHELRLRTQIDEPSETKLDCVFSHDIHVILHMILVISNGNALCSIYFDLIFFYNKNFYESGITIILKCFLFKNILK